MVILGFLIGLTGFLLNSYVVLLNGGMPVLGLPRAYSAVVPIVGTKTWVPLTASTPYPTLADIIELPWGTASIGDFLLWVGILVVILGVLRWFNSEGSI